jgi:molecular chaperone GrpE
MSNRNEATEPLDPKMAPESPDAPTSPPVPSNGATTEPAEPADAATSNDSAPDLDSLKTQAAKAAENWDLYLRARAELDNYRRRATRDRQEAVRYASQGLVEKLLPVLDSLEKAAEAAQTDDAKALESLREGVVLVQGQFRNALAESGIEAIDATGQPFDPNLHEAVAHHESAEVADGHVLQQIRKGYRLHERLVRPATVVVAKAPGN